MLHAEYIESLRQMTPEQRFEVADDLMRFAWDCLLLPPPEERQRRLDLSRQPWNPPPAPLEAWPDLPDRLHPIVRCAHAGDPGRL
jgi:hypothetical protein